MWLKVGGVVAFLLLLGTGIAGTYNVFAEAPDVATPLQAGTTVGVGMYGAFGIAAAIGLALRKRWALPMTAVWVVAITVTAVLAPVAYAEVYSVIGVVIGGLVALGLGVGTYLLVGRFVPTPARR